MRSPIKSKSPVNTSKSLIDGVHQFLDLNKAENIIQIDLTGKADFADTMFIASGSSRVFLKALADKLKEFLHQNGVRTVNIEGLENCDWVLVDAQDVVIHLFRPEIRDLYNLEKMWSADFKPQLKQVI